MWNGKNKALTFSYDDCIEQDRQLVDIFNRYGMKCTFNLNSAIMNGTGDFEIEGKYVRRMRPDEMKDLYTGHEIAVHTLHHADLTLLTEDKIREETAEDKKALEAMFGTKIYGMAYPYGSFNKEVVRVIGECGILYSRTVNAAYNFRPQNDLLEFAATCHHSDDRLFELLDEFLRYDGSEPAVFCVWGHSYEFYVDDNWELMEDFCRKAACHDDIFYGTNSRVLLGIDNCVR